MRQGFQKAEKWELGPRTSPLVGRIPWRGKWQPTPVGFLSWEIPWTENHGRPQSRGLQRVESDTVERLSFSSVHMPQSTLVGKMCILIILSWDFPGCPVVRTSPPMQGVNSIPGQETKILHAWGSKKPKHKKKQKQYCNKFNKDFKNGPHQKTFFKKFS